MTVGGVERGADLMNQGPGAGVPGPFFLLVRDHDHDPGRIEALGDGRRRWPVGHQGIDRGKIGAVLNRQRVS